MAIVIKSIPEFDRRAKKLSKKYKSLKEDLRTLIISLQENPILGTSLGNDVYKVRIAFVSKGGGKRGGGRVLTYSIQTTSPDDYEITLLTIYDKSEVSSVSDNYVKSLLKEVK